MRGRERSELVRYYHELASDLSQINPNCVIFCLRLWTALLARTYRERIKSPRSTQSQLSQNDSDPTCTDTLLSSPPAWILFRQVQVAANFAPIALHVCSMIAMPSDRTCRVACIQQSWLRFAIPSSSSHPNGRNDAVNLNCGERMFEGDGPATFNYEINILFPLVSSLADSPRFLSCL
jgi:hypothetical protein